jgi:hypothetical protein
MAQNGNAMTHGTVSARAARRPPVWNWMWAIPAAARHLILPGDMSVMDYEPLERAVLRPGTRVSAVVRKGEDGVARAGRLTLTPQDQTEGKQAWAAQGSHSGWRFLLAATLPAASWRNRRRTSATSPALATAVVKAGIGHRWP